MTRRIQITVYDPTGSAQRIDTPAGQSLLDIARAHDLDIEGACEGSLACATCHVIIDPAWFRRLAPPGEEEWDMLDLAEGRRRSSRLGCQVVLGPEHDGLRFALPGAPRTVFD